MVEYTVHCIGQLGKEIGHSWRMLWWWTARIVGQANRRAARLSWRSQCCRACGWTFIV